MTKCDESLNQKALDAALDYGLGHTCPDWTFADVITNSIKAYVAALPEPVSVSLEKEKREDKIIEDALAHNYNQGYDDGYRAGVSEHD